MRRFLYYNQDSINSLLAQLEQGLVTKGQDGNEIQTHTSATDTTEASILGDLSAKVFGLGASLKGDMAETNSETEATSNLLKSVQEKILHDHAFDRIFLHFNDKGLIKADNLHIGDTVLSNTAVTFLDFDYFLSLCSENGLYEFNNDQAKKEIAEIKKTKPRNAPFPADTKLRLTELESQVSNEDSAILDIKKTIEMFKNTLPYNRFLMTDNYLVPFDDKYFRDDPSMVAFKYGRDVSVFGYVTNIIKNDDSVKYENDFAPLYDDLNKTMLYLFKGKDEVYIIHPVAVFIN